MRPVWSASGFQQFSSPQDGLEAMRRDLLLKVSGRSPAMQANFGPQYQPTLANLINTWAPPTENNSQAYVDMVSRETGIAPDMVLAEADVDKIIPAMIKQEGGQKAADYFAQSSPLTPEEEEELRQLEAEFGQEVPQGGLTPEEEAELAALEAEFGEKPAKQDKKKESFVDNVGAVGRSALTQGNIFVGGPFSDEAILAPLATIGTTGYRALKGQGVSLDQIKKDYSSNLSNIQGSLNKDKQTAPIGTILGEIGGSLATGGAAAKAVGSLAPKSASALASLATSAPVRTGAAIGAGTGGVYGFGSSEGGLDNRLKSAGLGALTGGAGGAIGSAIGSKIGKSAKVADLTSDDLRKEAGKFYKKAASLGGVIKSDITDNFLDDVALQVNPQTTAGKILSGDSPVTKITQRLESLRGKTISLDEAQEIDEFLGDAIDDFIENGSVKKQGLKLIKVQQALRDSIENAGPNDIIGGKDGFDALKEGRQLWSRAAKLRDVEKVITRAEFMDQPANAIKSGFRTLMNNPKKWKSYSEAEKKAIREAAQTGIVGEALRTAASRLVPIIAAGSGGGLGGGAAAQAASMAARGLGTKLKVGQAQRAAQLIANPQSALSNLANPRNVGLGGLAGGVAGQRLTE